MKKKLLVVLSTYDIFTFWRVETNKEDTDTDMDETWEENEMVIMWYNVMIEYEDCNILNLVDIIVTIIVIMITLTQYDYEYYF